MTRFFRGAPLLLGLVLVALLLWRFGLAELGLALRRLSPADLAVYLAFTVAVVLGYALRWQLVTRSVGREVPLPRLAGARLAGDAVGNLLPSARLAGEPVRVAIVHAGGVEATTATAGVAVDRLLETVSNIVCGLTYVSVFSLTHTHGSHQGSILILGGALLAAAAALAVPITMLWRGVPPLGWIYALVGGRVGRRMSTWLAALRRTEDHLLRFFRERPAVFFQGVLLSLFVESLTVCQYHFLLAAFGVHIDLPTLLLALLGTGVAHALPMPAALGTLEGAEVAVLTVAAGDPALGFLVGLILRLHDTLLTLTGLVALSAHGISLARLPAFRRSGEASA